MFGVPGFGHIAENVVVARGVIDGHAQGFDDFLELLPSFVHQQGVIDITLDHITHGHDEIRSQKLHLFYNFSVNTLDMTAGPVAHDGKTHGSGGVIGRENIR